MEHSESRYPTPQWAETAMQKLAMKIEAQGHVLTLLAAQIDELRCTTDANTKSLEAQLEKITAIMIQEFGGAW